MAGVLMMNTFNAGLAFHEFKQVKAAYVLAAAVAFLMSSYFVVGYLCGSLEAWHWGASEWLNGIVAIGLTGTMTAFQFFLYAKGDIGAGRASTILAVCVAAGFSLLSEVGQGVERDNIRMESKSIESPTYQAIVSKLENSSNGFNPYAYRLERATTLLAQCRENVSAGIWKDCNESEARVTAVEKMIQQHNQANESKTLALANLAKNLERDENNYHPLVNFIRQFFGVAGITASFLLSLIIIGFFEYAFHYLGGRYASAKALLLKHGFDVTVRERVTPLPVQMISNGAATLTSGLHTDNTPLHARVDDENQLVSDNSTHDRVQLYTLADNASVGSVVQCPVCKTEFKKRNAQHRFCCKEHRYQYHNELNSK